MEYDILIVGGGPAGLGAAIRAKQVAMQQGQDLNICLIDKGSEVGSHIISGNVFEPRAFKELFPMWRELGSAVVNGGMEESSSSGFERELDTSLYPPAAALEQLNEEIFHTPVSEDAFYILPNGKKHLKLPKMFLPLEQHNDKGNYIISLGQLCRWLGERAEEMGVDIFPGFAGDKLVYDNNERTDEKKVIGVQLKDVGIAKDGSKKDGIFEPGMQLLAKQTILAEGCRGSLTLEAVEEFQLAVHACPQHYGFGIKEVWEIDTSQPDHNHKPGLVSHTVGWPMDQATYGGSFIYHMKPNLIHIGYVVGLDYKNPHLSPYQELQRFKHHPLVSNMLKHGSCVSYGARCLNEGGLQAIPKLTFPGGVLAGCGAGFLNVPKIKGSHTALKTGMLAGEELAFSLLGEPGNVSTTEEVFPYERAVKGSWVWEELTTVRNCQPAFKKFGGLLGGLGYSGLVLHLTRGREPWTFKWSQKDHEYTLPAQGQPKIQYPKPDGKLSFEILENLTRSNVSHDHDQPAHLRIKEEEKDTPLELSLAEFDGPEQRFCPAKVYEYVDVEEETEANLEESTKEPKLTKKRLQINAQNCVHCKCCSIKTPREYIKWTVPEGGGGPQYAGM